MANVIFKPTSSDANLGANYSGGAVPSNGDTLFFTDESNAFPMLTNIAAAFNNKNIALVFEKGYTSYVGTSALPMTGSGSHTWTQIIFQSSAVGSSNKSFFSAGSGNITKIVIDSPSSQDDLAEFGGSIGRISVLSGKVSLGSGATVTDRLSVRSANGAVQPKLTIPSGTTLTGTSTCLNGGSIQCSASIPNIRIDSGEFVLDGSNSDISGVVEMYGGNFFWDAADQANISTIALAEVYGGKFSTRKNRAGRTLTAGNSYGDGLFDFSIGGLNVTFTAPIRSYGTNPPRYPVGASYTAGV